MPIFREMTCADRETVLPMVDKFYHSDALEHPIPMDAIERSFAAAVDPAQPLLRGVMVYEDDQPAGYLYITQNYSTEAGGQCVFIEDIYFSDEFRGRGLGKAVMSWLVREYPAARRFRLEVTPVNARAIALYEKSGYRRLSYVEMLLERGETL